MVQYIFTPWRDRYELLQVRQQLYGSFDDLDDRPQQGTAKVQNVQQTRLTDGVSDDETRRKQHQAVARVSMWMQRGNCPHMVESTALLMAAMLGDGDAAAGENAASSAYAIRAAYSAAFSR